MKKIRLLTPIAITSLSVLLISATASVGALSGDDNAKMPNDEKKESSQVAVINEKSNANIYNSLKAVKNNKQNVFINLLNCIDHYDAAEGEFSTTLIENGKNVTVAYSVDIPKQISSQTVKSEDIDLQIYCADEEITEANNKTKKYRKDKFISQYDAKTRKKTNEEVYRQIEVPEIYTYGNKNIAKERVRKSETGENEYYYRADLTNAGLAATSIFPQNLVFGFMSDFDSWEITGVEKYLNRQSLVIKGSTANADYADKLNVFNFEMRFDVKTGILLDFKGFDKFGELSQYLETSNIFIDEAKTSFKKDIKNGVDKIVKEYIREK